MRIDRALVTLLALTNRILVVCYVKIVGRIFYYSFSNVLCLTLEFSFVVFTIIFILTRFF